MAWHLLAAALLVAIAYLCHRRPRQMHSPPELPVVVPIPGKPLSHALSEAYKQVECSVRNKIQVD
jgi:hypothetical protein